MKKTDLKKELKSFYQPSAKAVALVEVPAMNYLMINGEGDPNTSKAYAAAIADVKKKKNPAALAKLRFEFLTEGICAQTLHVGPFSEEGPTIEKVHEFIRARGKLVGKHHEIYLSDIRKAAPEKWKTVVRQPMTT
jgi:hypothetical protein